MSEFTLKELAGMEPNSTAVVPVKLLPVMLTEVPPVVGPLDGLIPVTLGGRRCGRRDEGAGDALARRQRHRDRVGPRYTVAATC